MKKSLYLGASMLAVAAAALVPASAADMYRGEPGGYKDAPVYVPASTWTGFYLGAHIGGAWGNEKLTVSPNFLGQTTSEINPSGVFGGAQLGYNLQHGNVVFGLEADLGGMDLAAKRKFDVDGDAVRQSGGFYGDLTGRLGYAFGPALVYAKGGFAFFEGDARLVDNPTAIITSTNGFTGWTLGGGLEYALSPAWSVKTEYQHFDFGKEQSTLRDNDSPFHASIGHDLTVDTVKAGFNYHFGQGYEPLK